MTCRQLSVTRKDRSCATRFYSTQADIFDVFQHVGWICIDAKSASLFQFGLAIAAGEKAHRERSPVRAAVVM
jgi:hypothetical protein